MLTCALLGIAVVAATTLTPATTASAEGKYGNLTALWWEWVLAQPAIDVGGTNTNPVLDSTGEFAAAGQEDGIGPGNKYFFLTGTFGQTVTRTVTVPEGKILFFPIFNFEADTRRVRARDRERGPGLHDRRHLLPDDRVTAVRARFGHVIRRAVDE